MAAKRPRGGRRARRRAYHHGNLRAALVATAEALLASGGEAALSLREVARRAGVSQTAPYRHFADKNALIAAVAAEGFRRLARTMGKSARRASADDAAARVHALGLGYVGFARAHPALLRLMFGPQLVRRADYPALDAAAKDAYAMIAAAIARSLGASPASAEAGAATIAAWALVHGLSQLLIDRQVAPEMCGGLPHEALVDRITGAFAASLNLPRRRESR